MPLIKGALELAAAGLKTGADKTNREYVGEDIDIPDNLDENLLRLLFDPQTAGGLLLAIALVPIFANWASASRAGQTDTADFAADLLNSVEPYGVLVTAGDNDTFPLWYAQEVEGIRRDVIIACLSLSES